MKLAYKINNFLKNLSSFKFVIIMTLSIILYSAIFGFLISIFNINEPKVALVATDCSYIGQLIAVSLIAPILETLIFQYGVIKISRNFNILKNNNLIIILISSILFGLAHTYNLSYVLHTTGIGIFLAYSFIIYEKKDTSPFWIVSAIHSLKNFISFILIFFLK